MSACISSQGEYSDHIHDGSEFVCSRCSVFDEYGAIKEIANARHDTAQAVAIEREAAAGWHDAQSEQLTVAADGFSVSASIGGLDDRSARVLKAMREAAGVHEYAAQAIRNGEHVKP